MQPLKESILEVLGNTADDASDEELRALLEAKLQVIAQDEHFYHGWIRSLITFIGIVAVAIAIASVFAVRVSKEFAVYVYMFWAIAPPSWFFIEWVWLFKSRGDAHRLNQFKTTIELAQKFWAGVLVLLAVEILLTYGLKV